jgi:hypothetical protein
MSCYEYQKIGSFGSGAARAPMNHPLTYVMSQPVDNSFMHMNDNIDENSKVGQAYVAQYCANNFDGFCTAMANNNASQYYPNQLFGCTLDLSKNCFLRRGWCAPKELTKGQLMLINTARTKYLYHMRNGLANKVPFDCLVADSPLVTIWSGEFMVPEYAIPQGLDLDNDPVMNRLLLNPDIAMDILSNIYMTMQALGRLDELKNTRLGRFYNKLIALQTNQTAEPSAPSPNVWPNQARSRLAIA